MSSPRMAITALCRATIVVALMAPADGASAQGWPARPIKLSVAAGPGLAVDVAARVMADRVTAALGQQVYVENIAGASGVLGTQAVARSAPDGYTFLFGSAGALSTNMFLFKTLPYDLDRDFTPVALVVQGNPFALTANPDTPIKTLSDLTAYAKAHPGKVSYAVDTSSGWAGIIGQLLNKRLDIDMVQIPYKSTSQALQDTATGTTQLMVSSAAAVDGYAKSGRLSLILFLRKDFR
jgi:tripartite-type tricarboxylate transporter receptor subunit TctC